MGIFFDGDADRALFVDENGEIIPTDLIIGVLAAEELKKHPNEKVYYDLRFSKIIKDVIKKSGGLPVMMRVGNPFYKEKMIKEGGVLAAEFSGHIMFSDNFCIDDGLFASVKLLSTMCRSKKKLSELVAPLRVYATSEEISLKVDDQDGVFRRVSEAFSDGKSVDMDGLYIEYDDWWFNLRKSNTEPLVRLRLEAKTDKKLNEMRTKLLRLIKQ